MRIDSSPLVEIIANAHPAVKLIAYFNVVVVVIWAPLGSSVAVSLFSVVLVACYRRERGFVASPWMALGLGAVAVILALPYGTADEIWRASELAIRIVAVMTGSGVFGLVFGTSDIVSLAQGLRLPRGLTLLFVTLGGSPGGAARAFRAVSLAQKSRGLKLSVSGLFRADTYSALSIPYIIAMLRSMHELWISLGIRPASALRPPKMRLRVVDALLAVFTVALWLI